MFASYLSPLASAAILLLGAFVLSIGIPLMPSAWQTNRWVHYVFAPGLVGAAILSLLFTRLTFGPDAAGEGLETLSSWHFSDHAFGLLNIRADELGLTFLVISLLLLLVVALMTSPLYLRAHSNLGNEMTLARRHWRIMSRWLLVGAGMCFLLVSANILTLGYAIIGFEAMLVIYWLRRGQSSLAIGRLFLGILTTAGFVLVELSPNQGFMSGQDLLGLVLWLRLGVYPFIEVNQVKAWRAEEKLVYLGVTLIIGVYFSTRVTVAPLPQFVWWLAVVMMLINGLLVWLSEDRQSQLTHLILTEILLLLLVVPLALGIGSAAGLALILSLIALWVTPHLGRPNFSQTAWLWPYFPAALATLTLIGLPYSLGWLVRTEAYRLLLMADNPLLILMVFLAEILALSGLVRYWQILWQVKNGDSRRLAIGIAVMVPFLIPGLGPFILNRMVRQTLPEVDLAQSSPVLVTLIMIILGAFGVTYFRSRLFEMLRIGPARLTEWLQLQWLAELGVQGWTRFGKGVLRLDVILEGQYYIGWAIFATLVGALLIFLRA